MAQLVCEVVNDSIVAGPFYADEAKCGTLIPCKVVHEDCDTSKMRYSEPLISFNEDKTFITIEYKAMPLSADLSLYNAKIVAKEAVKNKRKQTITSGITVEGVADLVLTDFVNQTKITNSVILGSAMSLVSTVIGDVLLPLETVKLIASGIFIRTQQCFTRNRQLDELIDAAEDIATVDTIMAEQLDIGW